MDEILLYKTDNAEVKVEILLQNENLWLTQAKMADLFDVQKAAISKHLKNIFAEGELQENSVVSKMETTAADGKNYNTNIYNLDAIIAVGYRINSKKATMFRIWATQVLKEYIIKGFAMNDERLKNPVNYFGKDYFEEQLERIREIRASERRFYQKITISMPGAVQTIARIAKLLRIFSRRFRTSCIMQSRIRLRQKSFIQGPIVKNSIWDLRLGKTPPMGISVSRMFPLPKITFPRKKLGI